MATARSKYTRSFRKVFEDVIATGEPRVLYGVFDHVVTTGEPADLYQEFMEALQAVTEKTPDEQRTANTQKAIARFNARMNQQLIP